MAAIKPHPTVRERSRARLWMNMTVCKSDRPGAQGLTLCIQHMNVQLEAVRQHSYGLITAPHARLANAFSVVLEAVEQWLPSGGSGVARIVHSESQNLRPVHETRFRNSAAGERPQVASKVKLTEELMRDRGEQTVPVPWRVYNANRCKQARGDRHDGA
jgi:hypothetical protein